MAGGRLGQEGGLGPAGPEEVTGWGMRVAGQRTSLGEGSETGIGTISTGNCLEKRGGGRVGIVVSMFRHRTIWAFETKKISMSMIIRSLGFEVESRGLWELAVTGRVAGTHTAPGLYVPEKTGDNTF